MQSDSEDSVEPTTDQQKPKTLIRSQYKDVMVKVDEDVYYLDRLQLALKSGYFEKLFIEDYRDKNCDLIEIPLMDTETFSAVVDIMYGQKLDTVANADNFVSLLMAMDYLQMDVDAETYEKIVKKQLSDYPPSPLNLDVFKLYKFIAEDATYKYLLPVTFKYLSCQLENIQDRDEFLSISFRHLFRIIKSNDHCSYDVDRVQDKHEFCRTCAKWICHDVENRLPFAIDLVNAAKFRFFLPNQISHQDSSIRLPSIDEYTNQDVVSRFFYKLLQYNGEIFCSVPDPSEPNPYEVNENAEAMSIPDSETYFKDRHSNEFSCSRDPKLETFLANSYFYDITVKVGEKIYQLHRFLLKSTSAYFETIFSVEFSEVTAQCEGIPSLPNKDKMYVIDNIESATFDVIIQHIYLGKVEFTPGFICRLFKAVHILKIDDLLTACRSWMRKNCEDICPKDVIEILNFTYENTEYKDLNRCFLSNYIVNSWPEIDYLPQFADLFEAITLPADTRSNEKVNFSDKTDQETFKLIINHIYFDKIELKEENIVRVLKASYTFKIEKLTEECVDWLTRWPKRISSEHRVELLRFAGCTKYADVINAIYLIGHVLEWPEIDNTMFCSISFDCLETMLMAPNFSIDDPRKIVDICTKWIVYDTKSRFCLIPQIALAISRNRRVHCDDFSITIPSDFSECSQDFVKEKLWKILSATSVLPPEAFQNDTKKPKTENPVFIQSRKDKSFRILNADGDELASFYLCEYSVDFNSLFYHTRYPMSATMINNNVFILCSVHKQSYFHVYNIELKKLYSLASDARIVKERDYESMKYVLLNCRNKIYCCLEDGTVFKYLFKMNRWVLFSEPEADKTHVNFTSDGNQLYRIFITSLTDDTILYAMECYNFEQNSWVSLPNFPVLTCRFTSSENRKKNKALGKFIFLDNYGFAVIFENKFILLDRLTQVWRRVSVPYNYYYLPEEFLVIGQNESNEMLCVVNNKLYQFSEFDHHRNEQWELKKEWPMCTCKVGFVIERNILPFGNIIAIHKPNILS